MRTTAYLFKPWNVKNVSRFCMGTNKGGVFSSFNSITSSSSNTNRKINIDQMRLFHKKPKAVIVDIESIIENQKQNDENLDDIMKHIRESLQLDELSRKPPPRAVKRCGVIGMKLGMMQIWDQWGQQFPVTVVKVEDCQVIQVKKERDTRGLIGLQVGAFNQKLHRVTKPLLGHFARHNVYPKRKLWEFRVTPEAALLEGTFLHVRHFVPGQYVDVIGTTKGKGFAGVMKRHGFAGQDASHGVSKAHRSHGSLGPRIGKVFKGKKMAGRMGGKRKTDVHNQIIKLDVPRDLLYIKGCLPGNKGSFLMLRDSYKQPFKEDYHPFPTWDSSKEDERIDEYGEIWWPKRELDPFRDGIC